MTDLGRAGVYAAAWVPATVLAAVAEDFAIGAVNATGARNLSGPLSLALDVVPALLIALALYIPVAFFLHRGGIEGGVRAHLVRGSVLYGLAIILGLLLIAGSRNADFGLFAQLLLWPAVTGSAGILADLLVGGLATPIGARAA